MKKLMTLMVSLTAVLLLSGCWDITEPQRMYYVDGIGIDFKDGQYEIYMQIINFANVAKSEGPTPQAAPSEIGFAKGKTMEEAFFKLYRSIDQKVFWGHMTFLIFSEDALKNENAIPVIDSFLRHRETRYQILTFCTKDPIKDLLLVTPILNKSLTDSKLSNPMHTKELQTYVEPIDLRKLILNLNEPSHEANIPLMTINKNWETTDEPTKETALTGFGVVSKDGFKGYLNDGAARGVQWMYTKKTRGDVTFKLNNKEKEFLTVDLEKLSTELKPIVKNNEVTFEVDVKLNATINGFKGKVSTDEIRKGIIRAVKKDIKNSYAEGLKLDVDVFRLSETLYRKNVKAWKKLQKDGKIPLTEDTLSKINITVIKVNPGRITFAETIKE
ncbi:MULTISPECIES: Ger(x)C family spore germination protein [unclassified Lysinibacillus]|uniref:Ger(x)C family spore germination protein n=1 Tax=unclassified Lysinibacillus TaxID=2636778 RepID=UPI002012C787|nr:MULTISPECIES: Ger(x)C family spore germination protein [unclassified Lysinibacillus]MCL1694737.1 Ger(x)C family spore germination protein [Lysinibacillus sp. BPa_S21]MCL1699590.1 Ger(x)C family spore germination protein [Lysinibacillus sp. Bpr_S20]